ncbi:sigma-70 family RNA polymerase sigma factor [uncultured Muribaculum sp.]|uniref:RNA polymerase sigma factor n=1 Tax=uncultured Muribaculum sp. TaxID=1918613 RepID=UPI0025D72A63|nr:sigma-70 family RNA polymerase sigma factor [uncultured Muribaculum sp.]
MPTVYSSEPSETERQLAVLLKGGSVKAFEAVYRRYSGRLYAYCFEAIRVRQEAEEVVHDVFMALWNRRESIDPEMGVGALLYDIARKRRIDAFRRLLNSPVYEDYVEIQNTIAGDDAPPMEYEEFMLMFRKVISGLPERMRSLIILSKFEGMTNGEMAARLGIAEKTVRNQLSLALKLLKSRLRPYLGDERHQDDVSGNNQNTHI